MLSVILLQFSKSIMGN